MISRVAAVLLAGSMIGSTAGKAGTAGTAINRISSRTKADTAGTAITRMRADSAVRVIDVVGFDYAFRMPAEAQPGRAAFRFRNAGKVRHEFNVTLLKPGTTLAQFMAAVNARKPLDAFIDAPVGVLFAEAGGTSPSMLATTLLPGRTYAVRCIFRDDPKAKRHQELGMFMSLHVSTGSVVASRPTPVDTIVATDYAFQYARSFKPGRHSFALVNRGKQGHEVSVAQLRKGVTLTQFLALDKAGGDVGTLLERDFGLLHAMGGTTPQGLLLLDLEPGREYLLECDFTDTDKAPPHYTLGMIGSFRVSAAR